MRDDECHDALPATVEVPTLSKGGWLVPTVTLGKIIRIGVHAVLSLKPPFHHRSHIGGHNTYNLNKSTWQSLTRGVSRFCENTTIFRDSYHTLHARGTQI